MAQAIAQEGATDFVTDLTDKLSVGGKDARNLIVVSKIAKLSYPICVHLCLSVVNFLEFD